MKFTEAPGRVIDGERRGMYLPYLPDGHHIFRCAPMDGDYMT